MTTDEIIDEIKSTEEIEKIVKDLYRKCIEECFKPYFYDDKDKRPATKNEINLVLWYLSNKKMPPLEELYNIGINLNTFLFSIDESGVIPLFVMLVNFLTSKSDDETCKLIDKLSSLGYDFNTRTIYSGGNMALFCTLRYKPKAALKLLKMGVDYNVTNRTLDTIYSCTKERVDDKDKELSDSIMVGMEILDQKQEIMTDFKVLLDYLEENGITNDINDPLFSPIDDYIEKSINKYDIDEDTLKRELYVSIVNALNTGFSSVFKAYIHDTE